MAFKLKLLTNINFEKSSPYFAVSNTRKIISALINKIHDPQKSLHGIVRYM